jgi:hypothetical protein
MTLCEMACGLARPLLALPTDVGHGLGTEPAGNRLERGGAVNGRHLGRVSDKAKMSATARDEFSRQANLVGACHSRFVDEKDGTAVDLDRAWLPKSPSSFPAGSAKEHAAMVTECDGEGQAEIAEKSGEGLAFHARVVGQDLGSLARGGGPQNAVAFALPGVHACARCERLARTGISKPDAQASALFPCQVADEGNLLWIQSRAFLNSLLEIVRGDARPGPLRQAVQGGQHPSFLSEDSCGGVTFDSVGAAKGYDVGVGFEVGGDFIEDGLRVEARLGEGPKRFEKEFLLGEVVPLAGQVGNDMLEDLTESREGLARTVCEELGDVTVVEAGSGVCVAPLVEQFLA